MKKILSLGLVGIMALSMIPTAFATTDYTNGTKVQYVGTGDAEYTITVPALLKPSGSGTVTLEGTWASDCEVIVTADTEVTLTNSINENDKKTLTVTFDGIRETGSNTERIVATETVSVGAIDNALFGTWSGKFNYNVEMEQISNEIAFDVQTIGQGILETSYTAPVGSTWADVVENEFLFSIYQDSIYGGSGYVYYNDVLVKPTDLVIDGAVYTVK